MVRPGFGVFFLFLTLCILTSVFHQFKVCSVLTSDPCQCRAVSFRLIYKLKLGGRPPVEQRGKVTSPPLARLNPSFSAEGSIKK